jgi:hypothetical protein
VKALLLIASLLLGACATVESPWCRSRELLASASKLRQVDAPAERLIGRPTGPIRAISLGESPLGNDRFQYSALVDAQNNEVWVYRHGGLMDSFVWFGPIALPARSVAGCPPTKRLPTLIKKPLTEDPLRRPPQTHQASDRGEGNLQ